MARRDNVRRDVIQALAAASAAESWRRATATPPSVRAAAARSLAEVAMRRPRCDRASPNLAGDDLGALERAAQDVLRLPELRPRRPSASGKSHTPGRASSA